MLPQLPPAWVHPLNDIAFRELSDTGRAQLEQAVADLQAWHHFHSAYSTGAEEQQLFDNLGFLIEELPDDFNSLDHLAPRLTGAVGLMERINSGRARASYSQHPVLNDLALAVACCLSGSAEERAVPERAAAVQPWRDALRDNFEARRPTLPAEAVADLEAAFRGFDAALQQLQTASGQALRDALADLLATAGVLEVLIAWRSQGLQQLARENTRWSHLPLIGARLQDVAEQEHDDELWTAEVRPLWTELAFWWGQHRDSIMLPAARVEELYPQVESAIERAQGDPPEDWGCVLAEWDALDAALAAAQAEVVPVEHLRGAIGGSYLELIQSLLAHTLPVFAVPALLNAEEPPDSWLPMVGLILEHTRGGDRSLLYEARDALWSLNPAPATDDLPDTWICAFCSHANPLGTSICAHCNARSAAG